MIFNIFAPLTPPQLYHRTTLDTTAVEQRILSMKPAYREVVAIVTYYTASDDECGKSDGITASGTQATVGRTIAMSDDYPFGTKVIINNHEYTVEDRGGAITGNRVDVFTNDKAHAERMGRRVVKIRIKEE